MKELTAMDRRHISDQEGIVQPARSPDAGQIAHTWYFVFFLLSGFCGLVYQVVWLRLTMAHFGANAPIIAVVIALFMAGLGIGSIGAGKLSRRFQPPRAALPLRLYGMCEIVIATSAFAVPVLLRAGRALLDTTLQTIAWGSLAYYTYVGLYLVVVLLPWCIAMGATTPLAMSALQSSGRRFPHTFSYLYLANVIGAAIGTLISAFILIELLGLGGALRAIAVINAAIGLIALAFAAGVISSTPPALRIEPRVALPGSGANRTLWLLLMTGITSMGMEIVWIRLFTPYLGTVVYAFAVLLFLYLVATALGTVLYRTNWKSASPDHPYAWMSAAVLGLLPLLAADPRLPLHGGLGGLDLLRVAFGIVPFCAVLGFLTPSLVDRYSGGDPERAGVAYSVNILGSILGPLLAGFLFLPLMDERWVLQLLSLPLLVVVFLESWRQQHGAVERASKPRALYLVAASTAMILAFTTKSYVDQLPIKEVRRDYEATVIAAGEGMQKQLLVNGYGMTSLTPITKVMAHLPLSFLERRPENALVIAFGMGTTFRSAMTWQVPVTAVDLVPSVPALFSYFHDDGDKLLLSPLGRIVIDDGRRFLKQGHERYDVIIVDPPPPAPAVASSLLYSTEFYDIARRSLTPDGIVAQWLPGDAGPAIESAVAQAIAQSFPHVRVFRSVENWGHHFLASGRPIPQIDAATLAERLPPYAANDLVEWGPEASAQAQLELVISREVSLLSLMKGPIAVPVLEDSRPVNEYFYVRDHLPWLWAWWTACCI